MKYYFADKEKCLALGVYPHITLADARERRAQARKLLANGNDPGEVRKESKRLAAFKSANTFEAVAREWLEKRKHAWAPITVEVKLARLERYILPKLGDRPIAEITPPEVLAMLRLVEDGGTLDTARRVMQICGQIFMYAIATGRADRKAARCRVVASEAILGSHEKARISCDPQFSVVYWLGAKLASISTLPGSHNKTTRRGQE
jgi:hypothetical protein